VNGAEVKAGYDPVLFDLDGTVVDTVELITASFRYATQQVLGEVLPDETIMRYVGQPLMAQMEQLAPDHAQALYDVYREHNHRVHDELIRAYEGVEAMLEALQTHGRHVGLVTSKSRDTTEMAFRAVGLREHFDVVVTATDTTMHKPSPEPLLLCLQRLAAAGAPPQAAGAIYIGDSPFDIQAGHAAGMATAAVTWGIFSRTVLELADPDYVLERPGDVVRLCVEGDGAALRHGRG
jgi:pyrophosphatase PpaX